MKAFKTLTIIRNKLFFWIPYSWYCKARDLSTTIVFKKKYHEMLNYLEKQTDPEIEEILPAIRHRGMLSAIYGEWTKEYDHLPNMIRKDSDGCFYVNHKCCNGSTKKIYLRQDLNSVSGRTYYESIIIEQDERSPHCYFAGPIRNELITLDGGTVLDLGGAEGVFTIECIDHADKVYCFDADENWIEPLRKTLSPYSDKAVLVPKFVSDVSNGLFITVDDYFGENIPRDIRIIKMDIEGFEPLAIKGMKRTLEENPDAIVLVCAYHTPGAETEIRELMASLGYEGTHRKGYYFPWILDNFEEPYIRRGVIEFRRHFEDYQIERK